MENVLVLQQYSIIIGTTGGAGAVIVIATIIDRKKAEQEQRIEGPREASEGNGAHV